MTWIETDDGMINSESIYKIAVVDTRISFFTPTNSNPKLSFRTHDAAIAAYEILMAQLHTIRKVSLTPEPRPEEGTSGAAQG